MKVVAYEKLPSTEDIQPQLAWLLSKYVSGQMSFDNEEDEQRAGFILDDVVLNLTTLQGSILQMEADAMEFDVEEGATVFVFIEDTAQGWDNAVDALRATLAETIVGAGEYRLEKEATVAALYGAELWSEYFLRELEEHSVLFESIEKNEKNEALEVLKAVVAELGYDGICCECSAGSCVDDPPHIDLDGHPLE